MAPGNDCTKEMFVIVGFAARRLGAPLVRLDPVKPGKAAREAPEDRRYRAAMG